MNEKYRHIISLGHFCSVADELKRLGLRDTSSPFDWLISDFFGTLKLIENGFKDFLSLAHLQQNADQHNIYSNTKYNIHFYHDFVEHSSLEEQIGNVQLKYNRRIERFYKNIKEPTLFLRYIKNQDEYDYIASNTEKVVSSFKKYNEENNIIFISNNNIQCKYLTIYTVIPDENDVVARKFLDKNSALKNHLLSVYKKSLR